MRRSLILLAVFALAFPVVARAEVGDPTLKTDHPHYPGEGAFQTTEDCVKYATAGEKSPQERAIAMYLWILSHQWHLMSPQEWNVPGDQPDTKRTNYDMVVYDANRARFSYGYGLCGTVHAWNEVYWKALGMNARRRAFPGHTNSEIEYAGGWHAFDTDMAGLVFRPDGVVAGYEDIMKDPSMVKHVKSPIPCYPFAWPADFNGMKKGWEQVSKNKDKWYKMYNAGYEALPGVVRLKSGETFTRYFDRDHFGGESKRRFWHNQPGGPFRDWTFCNNGDPVHKEGRDSNSRGNASYCNAEFVYTPALDSAKYAEGVSQQTANLAAGSGSPKLKSKDGQAASVTFRHFSPYVICGDPADNANPMTGKATDGLVISGRAAGRVKLEVSADQGQTWKSVAELSGDFQQDATDLVKGRYGWDARFSFDGKSGLDAVTFSTTTQVSQAIYPRLKPNGSQVTWRAASRGVVPVQPNFAVSEQVAAETFEARKLRSDNLKYTPRDKKTRYAYSTTNNKPAMVVLKVTSPRPLTEVTAAARFSIRVPPPKNADFHLEVSTDGGKKWQPMGKADIPTDNEYSSGWVYGKANVSQANTKEALVRVHLYAGGYSTGLIDAEAYGVYQTGKPQEATVTYAWKEGKEVKHHRERVPPGKSELTFKVPTGAKIVDEFVRIELP